MEQWEKMRLLEAKLAMWKDDNPLRQWRKMNGLQAQQVAVALGVSHISIGNWEGGTSRPRGENMKRIENLTSIASLTDRWDEWMADRPTN